MKILVSIAILLSSFCVYGQSDYTSTKDQISYEEKIKESYSRQRVLIKSLKGNSPLATAFKSAFYSEDYSVFDLDMIPMPLFVEHGDDNEIDFNSDVLCYYYYHNCYYQKTLTLVAPKYVYRSMEQTSVPNTYIFSVENGKIVLAFFPAEITKKEPAVYGTSYTRYTITVKPR